MSPNERLVVADFQTTGIDSGFGVTVAFAVARSLEQSRSVRIVTRDSALLRMRRAPNSFVDLAVGRELALREGVRAVVDGHIIRIGSSYDLGVRLVSADSGVVLTAVGGKAKNLDDVIRTIDRLARELRTQIGESLDDIRATPALPQVTTHSMEALRLYAEATKQTDIPLAIRQLKQAVAIDGEFAAAWRLLAVSHANGRLQNRQAVDTARARAYHFRTRLPERERLRMEASYHAARADRPKALELELRLNERFGDGLINAERFLYSRREFTRAESLGRVALVLQPRHPFAYSNLATDQVEQGNLRAAEETIGIGRQTLPGVWDLEEMYVRLVYLRGDLAGYERMLDSIRGLPDVARRRIATEYRRDLALLRGRVSESTQLQSEWQALDRQAGAAPAPFTDGQRQANIDLWIRGDTTVAVKRLLRAEYDSMPVGNYLTMGAFFATAGRTDLARKYLARWQTVADTFQRRINGHAADRLRGAIARSEGRLAESLEAIRKGDVLPDGPVDFCRICFWVALGDAFDRGGWSDSAIVMFERYADAPSNRRMLGSQDPLHLARVLQRLGELHEIKGNAAGAVYYYSRFITLWQNADPELQPRVTEVRQRVARLKPGIPP